MAFLRLKCPNCGGSIQMDDTKEKGFCMFCGSGFIVNDVKKILIQHSGSVELNRIREIDNRLLRAEQKIDEYKSRGLIVTSYYDEIIDSYIEKVLDIEPNYPKALVLKRQLNEAKKAVDEEHHKIQLESQRGCLIMVIGVIAAVVIAIILFFILYIITSYIG